MANIPISSFTAAANATGIGMSGFSLTGANAQSMLDLAGTWNTSGTPTAINLNVTDTASNAASLLMNLQTGGVSSFSVSKTPASGYTTMTLEGFTLRRSRNNNYAQISITGAQLAFAGNAQPVPSIHTASTIPFGWWSVNDINAGGVVDLTLFRDAANTLAQRNGTAAQTFRVYNTFTDASNYERVSFGWSANLFTIGREFAGTGAARNIHIVGGGSVLGIGPTASGAVDWTFSSGHLLAGTDNTKDIGASGASRPRNLFLGGLVNFGGASVGATGNTVTLTNNGNSQILTIGIATNTLMIGGITSAFPAIQRNGNELRFRLADDSGFCPVRVSQIGFNGATASFPMLSNNGATLQTKLADDSAFAPHAMQYLDVTDGVTAPGAAAGRARIYVDTADGDLKVVFADGTVKTIVTDT